jgi:hypothetical protein
MKNRSCALIAHPEFGSPYTCAINRQNVSPLPIIYGPLVYLDQLTQWATLTQLFYSFIPAKQKPTHPP